MNIEHKGHSVQLAPKNVVDIEVEAFAKDGKQGIEMVLEWEKGLKPDSGIEISISSGAQL